MLRRARVKLANTNLFLDHELDNLAPEFVEEAIHADR